jgi:hypothetical protein
VANGVQLTQFCTDAMEDFAWAGFDGPPRIIDIGQVSLVQAMREHRQGTCEIFVCTIQALREARTMQAARALMESGQWMLCIDEYHHYGIDKSWGRAALSLLRAFLLCLSATPSRPNDDSAFGMPDISVSYRDAADEGAVKKLRGHSYNYRVDLEGADGQITSCQISDLAEMAGGDAPDRIDSFVIERKMRWSPKYVSPLVAHPIERMLRERVRTGFRLQALIGAMSVNHARMVFDQIRDMYPELAVEWVGTGENGKSDEENRRILRAFCPPKEEGKRPPSKVDVLVHVGMAGEGLDSVMVSEVVHLHSASVNNRNLQINGRSARHLPGVEGHISFDASSEFAKLGYRGSAIMDAMDYRPPLPEDADGDAPPSGDQTYSPLPDEPVVKIFDLELVDIDSGDAGVQHMAKVFSDRYPERVSYDALMADANHPQWPEMIHAYKTMRAVEAQEHNAASVIQQLRDNVNVALNAVTRLALRGLGSSSKEPFEKRMAGDIKHAINRRKKLTCGEIANDEPTLHRHYGWLKQLERDVMERGLPEWLASLASK